VIGAAAGSDGGVDLAQGRSADAEEASQHDVTATGASATVGVELCGRPVLVVIRRRASSC
jgi:hypothetical protein